MPPSCSSGAQAQRRPTRWESRHGTSGWGLSCVFALDDAEGPPIEALDRRDVADPRLMQAADVGAGDLERLATITRLPVVAKGVLTAAAARE